MSEHKHTNRLAEETSPYLLQHAHNPVNWFAWGEEALQKAVAENKPILVSIGYSACHWCHVMEKESFEDEATAALMNKHFINIKIDREERPDLDHIYMEAVQAISGSGGWPLNVFLTPELQPFYGGTYFPPVDAFNRISWNKTLLAISEAYTSRKGEIDAQAANLMYYLQNSNNFSSKPADNFFSTQATESIAVKLLQNADYEWGGFGRAPKFPQTFIITYLLQYYHFSGKPEALQQALLSLDKIMMGGIYDHIGGGFARYSTDAYWKVPHFEKMLYDNALLLSAFSEAFAITKDKKYKTVISETVNWLEGEMLSPEGGFYSALDADSEGVEGKFYVWSKKEIEDILTENADWFCELFDVNEEGNWEESNILWMPADKKDVMNRFGFSVKEFEEKLTECKKLLLTERLKRIRPGLDDKILLSWNCLLISALCNCYAYTGEMRYKHLAERNMEFISQNLKKPDGRFAHNYKNASSKQEAFLDDYATLAKACIDLSSITGNNELLQLAKSITETVIEGYSDDENVLFYFTPQNQTDIILRKAEVYDGATPSGNAVMASVLIELSVLLEIPGWKTRSFKILEKLQSYIIEYPQSFGYWAAFLQKIIAGFKEIAIAGNNFLDILPEVLQLYIPERIVQSGRGNEHEFPLLRNKQAAKAQTHIYLCSNYTCKQPVEDVQSLLSLMEQ